MKHLAPPLHEVVKGTFRNAQDELGALTLLSLDGVNLTKYRVSPMSDETQYVLERITDE